MIKRLNERSHRITLKERCEKERDSPSDDDSEEKARVEAEGGGVEDAGVEEEDGRFGEAEAEVGEHVEGEFALMGVLSMDIVLGEESGGEGEGKERGRRRVEERTLS